jgi:hypothetical protein
MLLRLAQGMWPPESSQESCVQALKENLQREQLGVGTVGQYLQHARQFLAYLDRQQIPIERALQGNIDSFIAERLRVYRKKYGRHLIGWFAGSAPTHRRFIVYCVIHRDNGRLLRLVTRTFSGSRYISSNEVWVMTRCRCIGGMPAGFLIT